MVLDMRLNRTSECRLLLRAIRDPRVREGNHLDLVCLTIDAYMSPKVTFS